MSPATPPLRELQAAHREGRLSKADFIHKACQGHQSLWQFLPHLSSSEVHEIRLTPEGVQFLMGAEAVRLWAPAQEARVAPLEALNFGAYEPDETAVMNLLAADARCILDVGANIGYHALRLALREPQAVVHAFEALPAALEHLQRNVALNGLGGRVRVHSHGLSNANGSFEFFIAPENGTNASLMNVAGRDDVRRVVGLALTLDDWARNNGAAPDYIKVDVEGAELLVLQGGRATLAQHRPKVFAELLRKWSAPFGYHPNEVLTLMVTLGYGCWAIGPQSIRRLIEVTNDTPETNYAFLHHEAHAETIAAMARGPQGIAA
jgi:FkbM family methyltransferase